MSNDADEIRRKRLQKLQTASSASSPAASGASTPVTGAKRPLESPARGPDITPSISPAPPDARKSPPPAPKPVETLTQQTTPQPQAAPSLEEWQHHTVQDILRVTLDPSEQTQYVFLENLASDYGSQPPALEASHIPDLLWNRLSAQRCLPSPFDYLSGCWERTQAARRLVKPNRTPDYESKVEVLEQLARSCIDYGVITASSDPNEEGGIYYTNLGERLLAKVKSSRSPIPWDYVHALLEHADEDDQLVTIMSGVTSFLGHNLNLANFGAAPEAATQTVEPDYTSYFLVMENLLSSKNVAAVVPHLQTFSVPEGIAAGLIGSSTLLGPFFAVSPISGQANCKRHFPEPDVMGQAEIDRVAANVRAELAVIQKRLFFMCDKIVRASPEARSVLVKYFADIINLNHKRTSTHVADAALISSDGFMLNVTSIIIKLCSPFVDLYGSKMDKIAIDYFVRSKLVDITDETKLVADNQASTEFYKAAETSSEYAHDDPNFISHAFFLSLAYFNYGINGAIQSHARLKRQVDDLKGYVARLEAEISKLPNHPQIARFTHSLEMARNELRTSQAAKLALQCVLYDVETQSTYIEMSVFQLMVMVRVADPSHSYPSRDFKLVLPFQAAAPPGVLQNYPDYVIEAPVALILFVSRFLPQILARSDYTQLVVACVAFLRNTSYIKNPYLKAKLVEVLFYGSIDFQNGRKGYFVNAFDTDRVCLEHLLHALMNFYIEVEQTGASSQFYDKFNTRYYISQIFKCIWNNNVYRSRLEKESLEDVQFFVRFVALLLNDATYLFDESLTKLAEIHKLQKELTGVPLDPGEPEEIREKRGQLEAAEKHASSYMQLTNQTVALLNLFTSAVPQAFVTPEIVDRFAAMLNYNLAALVGPKCRELKVQNPEKYGFNPRELLSELSDVYINLKGQDSFIKAVARDGRSYNPENFKRARGILEGWTRKTPTELNALVELRDEAERVRLDDEQGELELGDIPDEFLDPLMYTLMEQPVILPSSRVTIDLSTIKSHLLSDPKDPFNRNPLTIEEVVPNTELKEKIEAFKKERRAQYLSGQQQSS